MANITVTGSADLASSMTSVTEDDSLHESDTTETFNTSNFSSLLSSTDDNTDDKLTPSLNSISISKGTSKNKLKNLRREVHHEQEQEVGCSNQAKTFGFSHSFAHPFASNSASSKKEVVFSQDRKRQKKHHSETSNKRHPAMATNTTEFHYVDQNPFTFDTPGCGYTDFSNNAGGEHGTSKEEDSADEFVSNEPERSVLPNMNSPNWFTAKVFDNYWSHYRFVMEWYREHTKIVHQNQSAQFHDATDPSRFPQFIKKKSKAKEKRKKRARKRRAAKSRQSDKSDNEDIANGLGLEQEEEGEEKIEMEITEDMMDFFSHSFKHRLERDKGKQEEEEEESNNKTSRIDIGQAKAGQQGPSSTTPLERPGVRRTAEMKLLYGKGAPMIHGMETALQMTFDKFTDRRQPKLWPNMPLKMSFT